MVQTRNQASRAAKAAGESNNIEKVISRKEEPQNIKKKVKELAKVADHNPDFAQKLNAQVNIKQKTAENPQPSQTEPTKPDAQMNTTQEIADQPQPEVVEPDSYSDPNQGQSPETSTLEPTGSDTAHKSKVTNSSDHQKSDGSTITELNLPDPEDVVIPDLMIKELEVGSAEGFVSGGWRTRFAVVRHGPIGAACYTLKKGKESEAYIVPNITPNLRDNRFDKIKSKKKVILALQGVVWNGPSDNFELLKPPTEPNKRGPLMLVKVKWNIDGEICKSWETRATVRKYYPQAKIEDVDYKYDERVILEKGSKLGIPDKAIIICAIRCAARYDKFTRNPSAWEEMNNRSPTPDIHIKQHSPSRDTVSMMEE